MDSGEQLKTLTSPELIGPNDRFGIKVKRNMQIEDCESKMQDKDIEAIHLLVQKNRKIWCFQILMLSLQQNFTD